jgi:formamidopyrimidine-DNA glycosylase
VIDVRRANTHRSNRRRHADRASRHVRQPAGADTRTAPRARHYDLLLDPDALAFNDPGAFRQPALGPGDPRAPCWPGRARAAEAGFDADYLAERRGRRVAKQFLRTRRHGSASATSASEALFRPASIRRAAGRVSHERLAARSWQSARLARRSGRAARRSGLRERDGTGLFPPAARVYERAGEPCRRCGTPVRQIVQGQRSTYFCPACQR